MTPRSRSFEKRLRRLVREAMKSDRALKREFKSSAPAAHRVAELSF
jgi:hypothetical protein